MSLKNIFSEFRKNIVENISPLSTVNSNNPKNNKTLLIVGLGNPGKRYAKTRHNAGSWVIDTLSKRHKVALLSKGKARIGTFKISNTTIHLMKTKTYLNESGLPVISQLSKLNLSSNNLLVICDDIDLPNASLRLRQFGGDGGHNGLRSIISVLGTTEFYRIRIGIDRPYNDGGPIRSPDEIANWVLSSPNNEELEELKSTIIKAADSIEIIANSNFENAMRLLN